MQVRDIMTREVDLIDADATVQAVARKMRDDDVGTVPVTENDTLIGIVTDRDIVLRAVAEGDIHDATARTVMSSEMIHCYADQSVEEVLQNMGENQVRRLPVVDRTERLVGMISLADLAMHAPTEKAGEALKAISESGG